MKWSEKKNPFKVGEKVKYVSRLYNFSTGVISEISGDLVYVNESAYHWRLCKKLKPKRKPREIWVNYYGEEDVCIHEAKQDADSSANPSRTDCVLFREVLKK